MAKKTSNVPKEKQRTFLSKAWAGIKEWFRKNLVALKCRPHMSALVWLVLTMTYFTLNTKSISYTSINLGMDSGGLIAFWVTLFSILVCVLFMNAYPKRAKAKKVLIVLSLIVLVALIACQVLYFTNLQSRLSSGTYDDSKYYSYFAESRVVVIVHLVMLAIALVLCSTVSLQKKLLKKIDTSVQLETNEIMESNYSVEEVV